MSVEDQETTQGEMGKVPSSDNRTDIEKLSSSANSNDQIPRKHEVKKGAVEPARINETQDGGLLIVTPPKTHTKRRRSTPDNKRDHTPLDIKAKTEEEVIEVPRPNKRKRKREDSESAPYSPRSKTRSPRRPKPNGTITPPASPTATTATTTFGPSASSSLVVDPNDPQKTKVMLKLKFNRSAPTQPSKLQNEIKIITSTESSPDIKASIALTPRPSPSPSPSLPKRQQQKKSAAATPRNTSPNKGKAKEEKHSPPPLAFNTNHASSYSSLVLPEQTAVEIVEFTNQMWKSYPRYLKNWNESESKTKEDTWYRRIHDLVTTANAQVLLSKIPNRGVVDGGVSAGGEKEQQISAST